LKRGFFGGRNLVGPHRLHRPKTTSALTTCWRQPKMSSRHSWFLVELESHAPARAATGGSHPATPRARPPGSIVTVRAHPVHRFLLPGGSRVSAAARVPCRTTPPPRRSIYTPPRPHPILPHMHLLQRTQYKHTATLTPLGSSSSPVFRFLALFLPAQPAGTLLCACLPY
jgi:hypothetical protein